VEARMMESRKNLDPVHVACKVCLSEVPHTNAPFEEVDDYVMYFCGLECYNLWRQKHADSSDT
jgi:hypothetical protein